MTHQKAESSRVPLFPFCPARPVATASPFARVRLGDRLIFQRETNTHAPGHAAWCSRAISRGRAPARGWIAVSSAPEHRSLFRVLARLGILALAGAVVVSIARAPEATPRPTLDAARPAPMAPASDVPAFELEAGTARLVGRLRPGWVRDASARSLLISARTSASPYASRGSSRLRSRSSRSPARSRSRAADRRAGCSARP